MAYVLASVFGLIGGAICAYLLLETKRRKLEATRADNEAQEQRIRDSLRNVREQEMKNLEEVNTRKNELEKFAASLKEEMSRFKSRVVVYEELKSENANLKKDIRNVDVMLRKLELDREKQREHQELLSKRCDELGRRYLQENEKWVGSSLTTNNYTSCKQRLVDVIERCRAIGFEVPQEEEERLLAELREDFEKAVRISIGREEQARIKAQVREEEQRNRELKKEEERIERERMALATALEKALAEAEDMHSAEIESLRARLAEAEASKRAISQAQLTKSGHVYVISNIGSFGEGVFKIGMTRRLEPYDRVKELGDASVPFPFDVHMMISCDDAPALENAIHRTLHKVRINKVNLRKEYFRAGIEQIRQIVEANHGSVDYVADAEALEFRQSATMSDVDQEYIEGVYDELEDDGVTATEN